MPSEETFEPTSAETPEPSFAQSIQAANASERTRSDPKESRDAGAREQSSGASFKDLVEDYNAANSLTGLKPAKPAEPEQDEFPLPAPTERELFLKALRDETGDLGRSNESEFSRAEQNAAAESFLDKLTPTERSSFLKHYDLDESSLENPAVRRILERTLEQSWAVEEEADGEDNEENEDGEAEEGEEKDTEKPEEPKPEIPMPASLEELLAPENAAALEQFNAGVKEVAQRAQQNSSPVVLDLMTKNLAEAMETPVEYVPKLRQVVESLSWGAQNYIETAVPSMVREGVQRGMQELTEHFGELLESYAPGLSQKFIEAQASDVWSSVISSEEFSSMKLPAYGTPEFYEAAEALYRENGWLNRFDPVGPDGRQLPALESLRVKAETCAKLLSGQRVSPKAVLAQVAEAAKTGKQNAERSARRVTASKSLGAGHSRGDMAQSKDTSFADSIRAYNAAQRTGGRGQ